MSYTQPWYRRSSVRGFALGFTIIAAIMLLVVLMVYVTSKSEEQWQQFVIANKCVLKAEVQGKVVPTSGYVNGKDGKLQYVSGTTYVPGTKTWLCADGVSYTR